MSDPAAEAAQQITTTERALLEVEALDFHSPRKRQLFERAMAHAAPTDDPIEVSRWHPVARTGSPAPAEVEIRPDVYDYRPTGGAHVDWWVNFADASLFFGWAGDLFAQDELQIAEHPALAALRVHIERTGEIEPRTAGSNGRPTPVLVKGVPRRVHVDLAPHPDRGLPRGIYGHGFGHASANALDAVCTPIDPPRPSNVLAMAAPTPGHGTYTRRTIEHVLETALTGFAAARAVSDGAPVVVHSGFWGCGAFGGNKELMVGLQAVAAGMAGIERLVVHTVGPQGVDVAEAGRALADDVADHATVDALIDAVVDRGFTWGASNGT